MHDIYACLISCIKLLAEHKILFHDLEYRIQQHSLYFMYIYNASANIAAETALMIFFFDLTIRATVFVLYHPSVELVLVSFPTSRVVDCGSYPWSKYKIGVCCFSSLHAALRNKSKAWLAQNQNNVSMS